MIHSSLHAHVLPRTHQHIPAWSHVDDRRLMWIGLWHPYLDWEAIRSSSKVDRQRSRDGEKQRGPATLVGVDLSARAQGGEDGESARDIRVSALGVLVFLRKCERGLSCEGGWYGMAYMEHAVEPREHLLGHLRHCAAC